jgi:hypothetical protein
MSQANWTNPFSQNKGTEKKELVEKMNFADLEDFKKFIEKYDQKLNEKYGLSKNPERIRLEKFKTELAKMENVRVESFLIYSDFRTRDTLSFVKLKSNEKSDEDVLATLRMQFNGKLKLPWMRRMNLFDYPFECEYRSKNENRCIILTLDFRKENIVAKYRIVLRKT